MRFSRIYDGEGGFQDTESGLNVAPREEQAAMQETAPAGPAGGGITPAPSEDPGPGPISSPAPQGGNPTPPTPPPPAVVSAVPGIQGSEATGGVQGSFGQAGSAGFSKRFGMPAAWFRGGPTAGLSREAGNRGRGVLGKDRAGQISGSYGAETVGSLASPSSGSVGGGKNDEDWQRVLRQVLQNRFQR